MKQRQAQRGARNQMYLKSPSEIAAMRRSGYLLQGIMLEVVRSVAPGVTTLELDRLAYARIREAKATPGFLNLYGFPNTLCISPNEQVVHGIPNKKPLKEGDIVSIDCGLILEDFFADMAYTVPVGNVAEETKRLLRVTRQALTAGIEAIKVDGRVRDIGAAIEDTVHAAGYHVVKDYSGHGVGRQLHEDPKVYNYRKEGRERLRPGLTLAIEPMVNMGTADTEELDDEWTVVTADRSLSAHYEHTVAVTESGYEILTLNPEVEDYRLPF